MSSDLESLPGVGSSLAKKLAEAGYPTIESIIVSPPKEISEKAGIGFNTVIKIQKAARETFNIGFKTALEFYEKRRRMLRCTTGSEKLDEILGGGVETQALTELIGEYGTGKTQLCLMLTVTAQLPPEEGGLGGNVAFIDTEGTFMPERVYRIAEARGLDPEKAANNVYVARAYNSSHQCLLIDHLFTVVPKEKVKLVVVDSMISHFRGEYIGRNSLAERQQKLNVYLHKLIRLSEAYNVAVVITNQVQANPAQFFGSPIHPAGGHIMAHACTHRVMLRRGKGGTRVARVIDSPYLPDKPAHFIITERGIEDIPEKKGRSERDS